MTVAPLRIVKKHNSNASPPLLPQPIHEILQDLSLSTQKENTNISHDFTYCRVIYAFSIEQSDASYLKLERDQIIHVHFQHFSGWTDGTLIATNSRGWFPLKYTEPYILMAVRPVVAASHGLYALFSSHKYEEYAIGISNLIFGVRQLLIRANSLSHEALVVKNDPAIRQKRKTLLSELDNLVSITKNVSKQSSNHTINAKLSNELIFLLGRIVLLSKQFAHMIGPEKEACDEPLSSPTLSLNSEFSENIYMHHRIASVDSSSFASLDEQTDKIYSGSLDSHQSSKSSLNSQTYCNPVNILHNLTVANEDFLSHLASFIGRLHLHSHTSSQLLLTTKQCVYTARELLSVIEPVSIKHPDAQLYIAKENFYTKITSFVAIVKKVITTHCSTNTSNEQNTIDKSESKKLIDAAANCVSGASQCVTRAKFILETIGGSSISTPLYKQGNFSQSTSVNTLSSKSSQTTFENTSPQEAYKSYNTFLTSPPLKLSSNIHEAEKKGVLNEYSISSKNTSQEPINNKDNSSYLNDNADLNTKQILNKCRKGSSELSHGLLIKPPTLFSTCSSSTSECNEKAMLDSKLKTHHDLPSGTASSFASSERFSITSSYVEHISSPATSPEPVELDTISRNKEEKKNSKHILLNNEGQVIGATLYALVERMTMHDTTPDAVFASTFYLTFRLFTTPRELALVLLERFPTEKTVDADHNWDHYYAMPVRLRTWMDNYWHKSSDEEALSIIRDFSCQLHKYLPQVSSRFDELVNKISSKTSQNTHSTNISRKVYNLSNKSMHSDLSIPPVIISKNLRTQLRTASFEDNPDSFSIIDFDPLEIARQLTLKESKLFCSILPEELVKLGTSRKANASTTVKAMAALSTDIAGWVVESILSQNDIKKRAAVMKQWIKIGNKCLELSNYNTLMAIVSALNSSTISRLKKTWNALSTKSKNIFENLRSITDYSRNYAVYRSRLKEHFPPCLPFLGLILTDITFIEEGNPSYRSFKNSSALHPIQLINYDKYIKIYSIISKLQQFQVPYKLEFVEGLQTWIESQISCVRMKGQNNVTELWRRSLALEPKIQSQSSQQNDQTKNSTDNSILTVSEMVEDSDAKKHCYNIFSEEYVTPVSIFIQIMILGPLCIYILIKTYKKLYTKSKKIRSFFHPYCNSGGGGERVLWTAIKAIQDKYNNIICVIYTGDVNSKKEDILTKTKTIFDIELDEKRTQFIYLYKRYYISSEQWPRFTLLGQSLGSLILAYEAINQCVPNIFIDTMGYAFTYPLISFCLDIPIVAYVHYPTISTDMLSKVPYRRIFKYIYWKFFSFIYSFCGHYAHLVITNSSWTQNHMESLWKKKKEILTIYPPCNTKDLYNSNINNNKREKLIVYLAQFRKEKNHILLLKSFKTMLDTYPETKNYGIKMVLIGSTREDDELYIDSLKSMIKSLNISSYVLFAHNLPWNEVVEWLRKSWIGVNTMWNEHFGISIVEYMAAELIPVVHDSGGPKLDIVIDYEGKPTGANKKYTIMHTLIVYLGYRATTPSSFAKAFKDIFSMSQEECNFMRKRARMSSTRFSEEKFQESWLNIMNILLKYEKAYRHKRIDRTKFKEY
ncbi:hypothetical protein PORY_000241 [Pneumocystis oryctolagi]|uniref:Uncharacterized protein n=1 Tax=Pneumocystis oryctolagi TaxID=42067 RepID=A0ACB7CF73_9ASCO|nr:hypothetical protein PORY_000241 [Pneumocystis oryctolagi]